MMSIHNDKPTQDFYKENPRLTTHDKRGRLAAFQVQAVQKHIGDLTNKVFLDIGAGDIVLGEKLDNIGTPQKFFVHDLSEKSIDVGLERLKSTGINTDIFHKSVSDCFDFGTIKDQEVDAAFSNSLFSHLSIELITLCLRNLSPKMKNGSSYLTSMIILPDNTERSSYDWSYIDSPFAQHNSYANKNPFHYTKNTLENLRANDMGFEFKHIHEYGHPFQKLVEFCCIKN